MIRDEIKTIIGYMKLAFPNFSPTLDGNINTIDVYLDLLGDIPIEPLWLAVKSCCAEPGRAFAPSAGEIRGKASSMNNNNPTAGEAWGAIMHYFHYNRKPPLLKNELVQKSIEAMGGLHSIGMSENISIERAHFLKIYDRLTERALQESIELPQVKEYIRLQTSEVKLLED